MGSSWLGSVESLGASRLYENVFSHSFRSDQQLSKATEIIHTSPMYQKLVHFPEMSIGSIFTASSCMKDEILVPRKQRLDEGGYLAHRKTVKID